MATRIGTRHETAVYAPPPPRRLDGAAMRPRSRWTGLPSRGDPRVPFAAILAIYVLMGVVWLGFNRSPGQILLIVVLGCGLDMALHRVLRERKLLFPLSAFISSLSIAILLNYAHDYALLALPVFLTIASKYLFTVDGRHHYNPSLFGVAVTLLVAGHLVTAAPAYQWGGTLGVSAFIATAALAGFVFRVGRGWLIVSFLFFYALQTALRAWLMRAHLPPEMLFLGTMTTPPFFLFTFFMLTDPKTSPSTPRAQVALAFSIALVDLVLHRFGSVFTFFYAAFAVATVRFLWAHGRRALEAGPPAYLRRTVLGPGTRRAAGVVVGAGLVAGVGYRQVIHPRVALRDAGFTLREVPPDASGIDVTMDPTAYDLVDPRLRHVSKWLLSVGASAAASDVNGDGLPDLVLTSPLAIPSDRVGLWLNRGGMRFERTEVPELGRFAGSPADEGLASGALFLDYDNDGDRDLLVLVSFGTARLLRNTLAETGRFGYEDVSTRAGVDQYLISVSANSLDYDRDGHTDLLIANVLNPHLAGYAEATRLNIFRLPRPAHDGDRRMFAFMHDGWHDAANGGRNVVLRNRGDGTFARVDEAAMGMPETHWSLSVGSGDFDGDGFTDLYIASDFGRDDLYLNERGRRFRRVEGALFGDVGRDTYKGMNSSVADFDRDGRLDVYVSNVHHALQAEGSLLWMNRRGSDAVPRFRDEAMARGALNEDRFGWGAAVGDLQNDGWVDIVQANGMVDDRLDRKYDGCPDYWYVNHKLMQSPRAIHTYADMWGDLRGRCIYPNEARRVYLNRGAGARPQFVDVAGIAGLTGRDNSRGAALADFDSDGRLDMVIANQHGAPTLLHNRPSPAAASSAGAWVGLQLVGTGRGCTRDAVGSTITVRLPGQRALVRETHGANGFSAQNEERIHIGLGAWAGDVPVTVRWCGGASTAHSVAPGGYHRLVQP